MYFPEDQVISTTIANFGKGVKDSLNMIDHGLIVDTNQPLYPLSKHRSERIFSPDALMKFFVEEDRIDYTTQVVRDQTEANSAYELFKKFETKVTSTGSTSAFGVGFSATAAAEYNYSKNTSENVRFAQLKLVCEVATIDMPEGLELRALLEPSFLEALDKISSMAEATKLVRRFGAVYISDATWGGTLSLTTSSQKTETTSSANLLTSLEVEMKGITNSGSVDVSTSNEEKTSNIQENFKYTMVGVGGVPSLVNDEAAWMNSISLNPAVVEIKVSSIAELALPDSETREFLEEAVIQHSAQYEGLFQDDLFLKNTQHSMYFHWKKDELETILKKHKKFCEYHMKIAKNRSTPGTKKRPKRKKKRYKASARKGLDFIKDLQNKIENKKSIQLFLITLEELLRENKKGVQGSYFTEDKKVYVESVVILEDMIDLTQQVGALALSGTIVSFYNEANGRFLSLDPQSKNLGVGKVTKASVLLDPENSEFQVKVIDKARAHVALYHIGSNTFLCTENNRVNCENFDESKKNFPLKFRFTFLADTSGINIQADSDKKFIRIDKNSFNVLMKGKKSSGSKFLVKHSA